MIPVAGPSITQKEIDYVADAVANGWYGEANRYPDRFQAAFSAYVGRRHAVALPSCTSAIHLALAGLGIGPGDEVIVPDATWIATAAPISYVGAEPVFVDVEPDTWCISVEAVASAITSHTRAIIAVDLYGSMPDFPALAKVAAKHAIPLIEDAAEAIGSQLHGVPAGAFGVASVFSFHGSKTLTTGEGGMLVTDDDDLFNRVLRLRDHGRRPGDTDFQNEEIAFKYKMSALQAALGLAQVERIEELVDAKRRLFEWYRDRLPPAIALNAEPAGVKNSYWMVTAIAPDGTVAKNELREHLRRKGIDSRPFFDPLSSLPAYRSHKQAADALYQNRVSYDLASRGLNLPSALCLSEGDVELVCNAFKDGLQR